MKRAPDRVAHSPRSDHQPGFMVVLGVLFLFASAQLAGAAAPQPQKSPQPSQDLSTSPSGEDQSGAGNAQSDDSESTSGRPDGRDSVIKRKARLIFKDTPSGGRSYNWGPVHPKVAIISSGAGVGPRLHFWEPDIKGSPWDVHASAAYSIQRYQAYELQFGRLPHDGIRLPAFSTASDSLFPLTDLQRASEARRLAIYASLRYRHYPEEDFYGEGSGTTSDQHTDYLLEDALYQLVAHYRLTGGLTGTVSTGLLQTSIGRGGDGRYPDTVDHFDEASAPGLQSQPDFFYVSVGVLADSRDEPLNPHRGTSVALGAARFSQRGGSEFDFSRVALDARHYIPLSSSRHVIAVRAVTSLDFPDQGSQVPFFLQSALGGSHLLRGYHSFRFRDDKLIAFSGEYRWEAWRGLELALFSDAGKVFSDMGDFDLGSLKTSYGVGVRLKSPRKVRFRIDVGRSREATQVSVKFNPSF